MVSRSDFRPAFVTPRYGEEVVGGAEDLARRTAEELARRGYEVHALSTRALDHYTWRDHYPQGATRINGVRVERFDTETRIAEPAVGLVMQKLAGGESLSPEEQETWLSGVVTSPALSEHIRDKGGEYSHLIFLPYLFGTTYFGSKVRPDASYIIPCLHDEPFARQPLVLEMLGCARGLMFNSPGERRLAGRLLGRDDPGPVVGMGFTPREADPAAFYDRCDVRGDLVLYAGRREEGKNTPLLVEYFRRFALENPGEVSLVLLGTGAVRVPPDSSHLIFDLGRVSEQAKWDAYGASSVFCQPSVNESLSIVLLESWLAGTPALVNRECDVTAEHVDLSGGGLKFSGYDEFAAALSMLLEDSELARRLGEAGRRYVAGEYNWDSVIDRLLGALGVKDA